MRIALRLEYDGTGFAGSQEQPDQRTVLGEVRRAIEGIDGDAGLTLQAAGRTDRGVHAMGQVVAFSTVRALGPGDWRYRLNQQLPPDVMVRDGWEVAEDFDPRRHAEWREYVYRAVDRAPGPLEVRYVGGYPGVEEGELGRAIDLLGGARWQREYREDAAVWPLRMVSGRRPGGTWELTFRARAFAPHSVRYLVALLMGRGAGTVSAERFQVALDQLERVTDVGLAPPSGLYLTAVGYPQGTFPVEGEEQ